MTELEKVAYAKTFIDKLANGINPIDDQPVAENDVINNVRLSRCFFYVSDVLRGQGVAKKLLDAKTLLITNPRVKLITSNDSDGKVNEYKYDYYIENDGTLEDLKQTADKLQKTAKDYKLVLGSNTFIPGFEDGIVGHEVGDKFDLNLTFPKDYGVADLAGAKVVFETLLKQVNEGVKAKIDDEMAAKCGPFKTLDELKADIKKGLM